MTPKPYREDIPYEVYEAHTTEVQRQDYWEIGVSLQAIDGLTVSRYAQEAARHYITGNCTTEELEHKIESYYETHDAHSPRRREADIVATRIAATLE